MKTSKDWYDAFIKNLDDIFIEEQIRLSNISKDNKLKLIDISKNDPRLANILLKIEKIMNLINELIKENPHLKDAIQYSAEEKTLYLRKVLNDDDLRKIKRIADGNFFVQTALI